MLLLVLQLSVAQLLTVFSMPDAGVTALWNRKSVACENANVHTRMFISYCTLFLVSFSLSQEDQECYHWEPDQEVLLHVTGSDTKVGWCRDNKPVCVVCIRWVH